jgi:hypothetical protein
MSGEQFDGAPDNYYLDMWDTSAYDYDSHQEILGLPNGTYTLTAAVRSSAATFVLFAATEENEFSAGIPNTGNSGNVLGGGWQYLSVENIEVTNNVLTIGVKGRGAAGIWVSVDVFRLYLFSIDDVKNVLQGKIDNAGTSLTGKAMQDVIAAELAAAITQAQTALTGSNEAELKAATARLNAAMDAATQSISTYNALKEAITEAETDAQSAGEGLADLEAAIADANAIYEGATLDNAAISEATATLKTAHWAYLFENTTPENPLTITGLIINPTFDTGNDGWTTTTGARNNGIARNQEGDFTVPFWENWNPSPFTGKMYQTISGLPAGRYTLEAAVYTQTQSADEHEWLYLYANENKTPVTALDSPVFYSVSGYVSAGTLEIGIELTEAITQWVGVDNFSLIYHGFDLENATAYLQEQIILAALYSDEVMNADVLEELQAAIDEANAAIAAPAKETLNLATPRLNEAIAAAKTSIDAYFALYEAIETANTNKSAYTDFPGYAVFGAAITAAQNTYDGKEADVAGIEAAIATLKAAEITCRLTQTAPFDATFVINNPSFEESVYREEGKSYNSPDGWILDFDYTTGTDAVIHTVESFDGINNFNIWSNGLERIDLYQELTLPPGEYELSAAIRTEDFNINGTQVVYAMIDELSEYESVPYEFPWEAFSETWETLPAWATLSCSFLVDEVGSSVRIGARSSGDGTDAKGWFQVDNFKLTLIERFAVDIQTPQAQDYSVKLQGVKGGVNITTAKETNVNIYAVTGQLIKVATINGKSFVSLLPGVYIIDRQKVIVK